MPRVKRGTTTKKRHKKLLLQTKGFRHGRKSLVKMAKQAVLKAGTYAYRDRKAKKRVFRRLWIVRLNAACRAHGISYSVFIKGLKDKKIEMDRKVLSDIAANEPEIFNSIIEKIKK